MEAVSLNVTGSRYQRTTLSLSPNGISRRFRVELRYLNYSDMWYLSIFDADTEEAFCRYVPVIASYEDRNDLLAPFATKLIGSIYCVPMVNEPATQDPGLDNMDEFEIVWADNTETYDDLTDRLKTAKMLDNA